MYCHCSATEHNMSIKYKIIALEGLDGTGKTSLANWLNVTFNYEIIKSPNANFFKIRDYFDKSNDIKERFCFYIGASFYISTLIDDLIACNKIIVLDRYYYSTLAYHYVFDKTIVNKYSNFCKKLTKPDLIVFLKSDYKVAQKRCLKRTRLANDNIITSEDIYKKITSAYEKYFDTNALIIENNSSFSDLTKRVCQNICFNLIV